MCSAAGGSTIAALVPQTPSPLAATMPKDARTKQGKPRPSITAWLVAAPVLYLSHHPAYYKLIPDAAVAPTRACLRRGGGLRSAVAARCIDKAWGRRRYARLERRILPGFSLHIAARKRYIEAAVRSALESNSTQVVILGGGYDTLALRLHAEFPRAAFIEVDSPGTQRIKLRCALADKLNASNLAAVQADLGKPGALVEALATTPLFRPEAHTVYVAEGLFHYLPPESVAHLLGTLRDLPPPPAPGKKPAGAQRPRPRARLLFSFLEPLADAPGHYGFPDTPPSFDRWLARREPFRWGIERSKAPDFFRAHGWQIDEIAGSQTLRQRALAGFVPESEPMAQGEYLAIADRL